MSPAAASGGRASNISSSGPATATATAAPPVPVPARPMAPRSARRYPDRVPRRPPPPPPGQPPPPLRPPPPPLPPLPRAPIVPAGPSRRRPGHFRLRGPAPPVAGAGAGLGDGDGKEDAGGGPKRAEGDLGTQGELEENGSEEGRGLRGNADPPPRAQMGGGRAG